MMTLKWLGVFCFFSFSHKFCKINAATLTLHFNFIFKLFFAYSLYLLF